MKKKIFFFHSFGLCTWLWHIKVFDCGTSGRRNIAKIKDVKADCVHICNLQPAIPDLSDDNISNAMSVLTDFVQMYKNSQDIIYLLKQNDANFRSKSWSIFSLFWFLSKFNIFGNFSSCSRERRKRNCIFSYCSRWKRFTVDYKVAKLFWLTIQLTHFTVHFNSHIIYPRKNTVIL